MPRAQPELKSSTPLTTAKKKSAIELSLTVAHLVRAVDQLKPVGLVTRVELPLPRMDLICVLGLYCRKKTQGRKHRNDNRLGTPFSKSEKNMSSS